jgi:hypothetical protein
MLGQVSFQCFHFPVPLIIPSMFLGCVSLPLRCPVGLISQHITTILVFHWGTQRKEISFTLRATNSWQLEKEEAVVVVVF